MPVITIFSGSHCNAEAVVGQVQAATQYTPVTDAEIGAAAGSDAGIAVDVTHATDTPGIDVKRHGEVKLGEGPTIAIGRENHPAVVERLRKAAAKKKIAYQVETFSITGGTDALAIWIANGGVPATIVSIPSRYMHSTVEMLDLRDLQKTAELLAAFCCDLKKNDKFVVKV